MTDYFTTQRTGTICAPRNCAAASGAMALYATTGGAVKLTADEFRSESGVSCIPGKHSASGGLFISDVIRVIEAHGAEIDYGRTPEGLYTRWAPPELARRCVDEGAVLLGDYDALPFGLRASATFLGDHSAYVHDYRESDDTICWHDPLRTKPIRIALYAAISYWQKPTSPVRGFAGFVALPVPPEDDVLKPGDDVNFGFESYTIDNDHTVYCIGGPRNDDGTTSSDMRLCAAGKGSPVLTFVARSRLTNGKRMAGSDALLAAITSGAIVGDIKHTVRLTVDGTEKAKVEV